MYSVRILIDAEAALVPRLLRVFERVRSCGAEPLKAEYGFSVEGVNATLLFLREADAVTVAERVEGEIVALVENPAKH